MLIGIARTRQGCATASTPVSCLQHASGHEMTNRATPHSAFSWMARGCAGATAAGAATVLLGWTFGSGAMEALFLRFPMMPITATALLLSALCVWAASQEPEPHTAPKPHTLTTHPARVAAAAVCALGAAGVAEIVAGADWPVDHALFDAATRALGGAHPGRMAPDTAVAVTLLGVAFLLSPRHRRTADGCTLGAAFIATYMIFAHAYGATQAFAANNPAALATALLLFVAAVGALCARPERGLAAIAIGSDATGVTIRRMLPAAWLGPFVLGGLQLQGQRLGVFDAMQGPTLLAASSVALFIFLLYLSARVIQRIDAARQLVLDDLQRASADERALNAELEQRVQARTRELAEANHEFEAFSYSVAHDLRAPLRQIDAFARLVSESPADAAERSHYLARIRDGAARMATLIDGLLSLGHVSRQTLRSQVTNIEEVVRDVVEQSTGRAEDRDIGWRVDPLPAAACDRALVTVVFSNLVANAVKFTRPRATRTIHIGAETRDGEAVFFVRDNGVGFDMRYSDQLFGVFQRLHRAEDFEGTGIGLATVDRIVRKHGGRIWADARVDGGATFYFTLPAAAGPVDARTAA
jgi:signal transduction histidine kinase